jgi:hypothetical protein
MDSIRDSKREIIGPICRLWQQHPCNLHSAVENWKLQHSKGPNEQQNEVRLVGNYDSNGKSTQSWLNQMSWILAMELSSIDLLTYNHDKGFRVAFRRNFLIWHFDMKNYKAEIFVNFRHDKLIFHLSMIKTSTLNRTLELVSILSDLMTTNIHIYLAGANQMMITSKTSPLFPSGPTCL